MSKAEKRKMISPSKSSLEKEIKNKENAFILFYASWCPFSQKFLPTFEEYAKSNPKECISIIIDDKPELCEEYSIEYYPTVLLFKKGKLHKRLDANPGSGLTKNQLIEFTKNS